MIPFPPFEPDRSPYQMISGDNLKNCLPVADGWGPMPDLVTISLALPSACKGAVYVRDASGDFTTIAGTATRLYKLNTATYAWDDISGPSAPYAVPLNDTWTFTRFGNRLIAHHLGNVVQVYDINAPATFTNLAGSPPVAKYSWVAGEFLVFGYLDAEPNYIQWSGVNDITFWTIGQRGADKQQLPTGEEVVGGIGDQMGAIVAQRGAMRYMRFAPETGYTFTISTANDKRGVVAPKSLVSIGPGQFVYLSEDGFFSGAEGTPIGAERVDSWFISQIDIDYLQDVVGVADPYQKIVWWQFQTPTGSKLALGWDWQLNRWCYTDQAFEIMVAMVTPALTWDGMDALYASFDVANIPFDARLLAGGRPTFAAFTTDHKLAYFSGENKAAVMETAEIELNEGMRTFVNGARVKSDATAFTVEVGQSDYHGGLMTYKAAATPSTRTKKVSLRCSGRLHRFRLNLAAGAMWSVVEGITPSGVIEGEQ